MIHRVDAAQPGTDVGGTSSGLPEEPVPKAASQGTTQRRDESSRRFCFRVCVKACAGGPARQVRERVDACGHRSGMETHAQDKASWTSLIGITA